MDVGPLCRQERIGRGRVRRNTRAPRRLFAYPRGYQSAADVTERYDKIQPRGPRSPARPSGRSSTTLVSAPPSRWPRARAPARETRSCGLMLSGVAVTRESPRTRRGAPPPPGVLLEHADCGETSWRWMAQCCMCLAPAAAAIPSHTGNAGSSRNTAQLALSLRGRRSGPPSRPASRLYKRADQICQETLRLCRGADGGPGRRRRARGMRRPGHKQPPQTPQSRGGQGELAVNWSSSSGLWRLLHRAACRWTSGDSSNSTSESRRE